MKQSTVLFLDSDGVFSMPHSQDGSIRFERWQPGLPVWPIPLASALVRAIDQDRYLHPVWLSAWDRHAWLWDDRAGTRRCPIGYYMRPGQWRYAFRLFPALRGVRFDSKLMAVLYYLRRYPHKKVVWVEDGFADEAVAWASRECGRVQLIDTTREPLQSWLRMPYADLAAAAQEFLKTYVFGPD